MLAMNVMPPPPFISPTDALRMDPSHIAILCVGGRPVLVPIDWDVVGYSLAVAAAASGRKLPELLYVTTPQVVATTTRQSSNGLETLGDVVLNPQEVRERRSSPIGSRHGLGRASTPVAPSAQQAPARPLPTPPRVAQADQGLKVLPIRPSSAPPFLERPPGLPAVQEVDERPAAVPAQPAFVEAPALPAPQEEKKAVGNKTSKEPIHNLCECQGDPLCPTHRRRPQRKIGPHARTPLQLWEARPKFGYVPFHQRPCLRRC